MGFQDRDYYRDGGYRAGNASQPMSAVTLLIIINVGIWLVNAMFFPGGAGVPSLTETLALRPTDLFHPWDWYRFVTTGFAHADNSQHIICNMLSLFFLGPMVEMRYGRREFLWFYLTAIPVGGIFWAGMTYWSMLGEWTPAEIQAAANLGLVPQLVGASGAVTAVVILFAFNFPKQMMLLFFVIPMPAWVLGLMIVGLDLLGSTQEGSNIAHSVHLAGAVYATLYHLSRFSFTGIFGGRQFFDPNIGNMTRPYRPQAWQDTDYEDDGSDGYYRPPEKPSLEQLRREQEFRQLEEEVEQLLRKISEQGIDSLTPEEMQRLREASKIYRSRR
ncbi:MAG: rhomboid family intramembrane serine protease [Planctomycetia bacterium]|nr:rhomboid family intramembrane serine protease [Planctomycetia bacterium]